MTTSDVRLAAGTELRISSEKIEGLRRIRVDGELDAASTALMVQAVRREISGGQHVRIDASGLGFVDSSGLRTLVLLREEARQAGGDLWVEPSSRPLERLLDLTALTDLMTPLTPR